MSGCLLSILSSALSWYLKTLCIYYGWYWFLLPVFPLLPSINKIQAFGIMLMLSLLSESPLSDYKLIADDEGEKASIMSSIFKPITCVVTLLIFYIVHLCIS